MSDCPFRINPYAAQSHIEDEYHEEFHQCQVLALTLRLIGGLGLVFAGVSMASLIVLNRLMEAHGVSNYNCSPSKLPWQYDYLIAASFTAPAMMMMFVFLMASSRLAALEMEIRDLQLQSEREEQGPQ